MFEWLSIQYLKLLSNFQILIANPTQCQAVDLLKIFFLTLLSIFLIKLVLHLIIFNRLKNRFFKYSEKSHPQLIRLYKNIAKKVNLKRLPPLYQFNNEKPSAFTIGSLKPAIFLAPKLTEKLSKEELVGLLTHEITHVKRNDNLRIWLLEIFFISIPLLIIEIFGNSFVFSNPNSIIAVLGAISVIIAFKAFLGKRILFLRELSCDDLTVDVTKKPLFLASSLMNVWRIGKSLPKYKWQTSLALAQTYLPPDLAPGYRVKRLIEYRRPWLKFVLGKVANVIVILLIAFTTLFLWKFYSNDTLFTSTSDDNKDNQTYACTIDK